MSERRERDNAGYRGPRKNNQRNDHQFRRGDDRHGKPFGPRPERFVFLHNGITVYIIDILQHGRMDRQDQAHRSLNPICQVMEVPAFQFYEVEINKGSTVAIQDKIVIAGENGPLGRMRRKLKFSDLTPTSVDMLKEILRNYVIENEARFVEWFNKADSLTIKRHSLEVLPGIGKKIMWDIINERTKKKFENFVDLTSRVPGVKPADLISKRIIEEIESDEEKHYLFVKRQRPTNDQSPYHERPPRPPQ